MCPRMTSLFTDWWCVCRLCDIDLGWCLNVPVVSGCLVHLVEACPLLERVYLTAHRQTNNIAYAHNS